MIDKSIFDLLIRVLQQIAAELMELMPKIALSMIILALLVFSVKLLNIYLGKLLKFIDLEKAFKRLIGSVLPFPISSLIVFMADLGVTLIALFVIANLFLAPHQVRFVVEAFEYVVRVISIVAIFLVTLTMFSLVIERVRMETKLKGYILFILILITTTMLIDITALTEPAKAALMQGLSLGVGLSVGAFALWFFFHDYIEGITARFKARRELSDNE